MAASDADRERESVRAEILAAARRLFMSRGYCAVSTRDIAEAVGVTQPALYHHFAGKEALYVAMLETELASISVELREAARARGSATERLIAVATVLARSGEHDLSQMFRDLRQEISDENRRRVGIAFRDAMMMPVLTVIDALVEGGSIDPAAAGMERGEVVMLLLSNVRMLVDLQRGPASGRDRTHEQIGSLAARLLLRSLSPNRSW